MKRRGHPVLGFIFGLLFGVFLAVTLVLGDLLPLNSIWVTLMPLLGVVYGVGLALWAPFGARSKSGPSPATPSEG